MAPSRACPRPSLSRSRAVRMGPWIWWTHERAPLRMVAQVSKSGADDPVRQGPGGDSGGRLIGEKLGGATGENVGSEGTGGIEGATVGWSFAWRLRSA